MVHTKMNLLVPVMEVISGIEEKLPLPLAVRIGRVHAALEEWVTPYQERVQELLKEHIPEGANELKPTDAGWAQFQVGIQEIMADDAELDCEPIKMEDLEKVSFTPIEARLLFEAGLIAE
jgi:hypothetical protein